MSHPAVSRAIDPVGQVRHPFSARAAKAANSSNKQTGNRQKPKERPAGPTGNTMTTRFEIGDVVRLKSGGQAMTVNQSGPVVFATGNWLICQWFDQHGELRQEMFHEDMVQSVEEPAAA
jgi:uncharacterized protein YodC (DUF2158 family)